MNFRRRTRSRKTSLSVIVNTEKWKQNRKQSRRGTSVPNDSDEDPQYAEIKAWVDDFFKRKSECPDKLDQDEVQLTRKQTLILSTLVPDELLNMSRFDVGKPARFVGVLLMADVSGYTSLSEHYNSTGTGGTYRLTATLNKYLGSLIELIYSHGGDIIKFAGDAFLALWKLDKKQFICHAIHSVIACALVIQQSYYSYETDVKVNLNVKLAISAGNLIFTPIGRGIDMNYIIFGLPVIEAKAAESVCASGKVILTATAWAHCYSRNYDYIVHENGNVTINSILYDPRDKDVTKPFAGLGHMIKKIQKHAIENSSDFLWESPENLSAADIARKNEALSLRKAILQAEEKDFGSEIRKFIIRPVLTQVDAHQPLEYLTEMRQVSVIFITLKLRECPYTQFITVVNNSYDITCEIVYKSLGCVNKIILFDKDVMILVIFGLRGFKHESEAQAALKCSHSIKKAVSALDSVLEVSIGVTTGQVYCGVVGHPLRREFTVIGAIVNKAARLMCGFRNKITCDETTYINSKMSSNAFTLQPKIDLKGIAHPGKIYEYSEDLRVKVLYDIPMTKPLLNRNDETEYFVNWIDDSRTSYKKFDALSLIGDPRIGKSRILEWMATYTKTKHFETSFITLTTVHSATPYLGLSQIINQILQLKEPITGFIKEEKIVQLLQVYNADLCYLNEILKVRFAYHEGIHQLNEQKRKEKTKEIFKMLVKNITEKHVIILDDLQNLDPFSWEYISIMFASSKIYSVFSVTRGNLTSMQNWLYNVFINNSIRKIVLGPLSYSWIAPLACQILDVNAVPNDLCNALKSKCYGMPGLIENFIIHLFSSGALELKKININELQDWVSEDFQFPDEQLLHPQAIQAKDQTLLDSFIHENASDEFNICIVIKNEELKTNIDAQNIDALVMIQIDSLTPYQQLLLKIASVIGDVLARDLLENIMYENDPMITAKSIKRLFAMKILCCANVPNSYKSPENHNLACECSFEYDPDDSHNLPKYAFCKVMKFKNKSTRKTCYELLPLNQKKEFHSRIVLYLENNEQKCTECGGALSVIQSSMSVHSNTHENYCEDSKDSSVFSSDIDCKLNNADEEQIASQTTSFNRVTRSEPQIETKIISPAQRTFSEATHKSKINNKYNDHGVTSILKTSKISREISRHVSKRVTVTNLTIEQSRSSSNIDDDNKFDLLRPVIEAQNLEDWHAMGVVDSEDLVQEKRNKSFFCVKIAKNVSSINISKCTCSELNILIYEQLTHHAQQADMQLKALQFMIHHCYLNFVNNDFNTILSELEDAEKICCDKQVSRDIGAFERCRCLGRIYSIRAVVFLLSTKFMAAKLEIEKAIHFYRSQLHKFTQFFSLKRVISSLKYKTKINNIMQIKSDYVFCLNIATVLYSSLGDLKCSRLFAYQALKLIQNVECNVIDICDALNNAIQVELDRQSIDSTIDIERLARQILQQLPPFRKEELFALGKLFLSLFRARISRGKLAAAIRVGFRTVTISQFLQADAISVDIIPELFYILLCRHRIEEAVNVVQSSLSIGQYLGSYECETWYYALCMDMILDAGFQLESPYEISRFAEYALSRDKSSGPSRRRLIVNLWTYWLRADVERKAKRFETEALSWADSEDNCVLLTDLFSSLRLAEGLLESLARKVDDLKKVVDMMELRSTADRELARLEKDVRSMRTIYPRWILLKAYSLNLSGRTSSASNMFRQALDEAHRISNRLEESLARAALSNSTSWLQSCRSHFPTWQTAAAQASWHQLMYKITTAKQV